MINFIAGIISGIISGMGIGGGTILIPILVFFSGAGQHTAQTVNLLYFIPTASVALYIHVKKRRVDVRTALIIMAFGILGAAGGAWLAVSLQGTVLKRLFAAFLLAMGMYEILQGRQGRQGRDGS